MIFLLDNYDSFTYNLVQRIGELDSSSEITVVRNDQTSLKEIEALGQCFDPQYHEAVGEVEVEGAEEGCVVEVLHKGYMIHDRLLRPAKVLVAKNSNNTEVQGT